MKFLQTTAGLVLLGAIALSLPAHAGGGVSGGGVSGGGNVLACKTDEGTETYQLLDYFDSTKQGGFGFELDLGPGKTYPEKIEYVLDRMTKFDSYRRQDYAKKVKSFFNDSEFSDYPKATNSNDLGSGYILPEGCEIKRAIILRSDEEQTISGNPARYSIVRPLWDQLDDTTKAGLMLHEIAYLEAIKKGAVTSLAIRRFVAFISSRNIATEDYSVEVVRAGLITWGDKKALTSQPMSRYVNALLDGRKIEDGLNNIMLYLQPQRHLHFYGKALGIQRVAVPTTYYDISIESQKLQCQEIRLYTQKEITVSPIQMLQFYQKLTSKKSSLLINDLAENDLELLLVCSGHLRVKSSRQSKVAYDMIIETPKKGFIALRSSSDDHLDGNYRVVTGHYDGVDVSGLTCETNNIATDPRRVVCTP